MAPVLGSIYNALKDAWLYIKHRRRHVIDLDDNFKTLNLRHGGLLASKEYIEGKLEFKTKNDNYHKLEEEIADITRKYEKIESRFKKSGGRECSPTNENVANGGEGSTSSTQVAQNQHIGQRKIWTTKFCSDARLDKDILKLTRDIDELKIKDVKLETLVTEKMLFLWKNAPERDHSPLRPYVDELLNCLEDENIKKIGIHGEPQVGKSTILKMLNNCFHPKFSSSSSNSLKYNVIIWVDFPSKDSGDIMENMQQQILRSIGEHNEQSPWDYATRINKALAGVNYLLIMDGVFKGITLADLGIHDNHKYGKIVIGATGQGVLNLMDMDIKILIQKLEHEAAEKFFKKHLALESSVDLSSVQPYINKIVELLGGHIGALVAIAHCVKGFGINNTDLKDWKDVVDELQSPNSTQNLQLGALENTYKLCYKGLEDNNRKKCLLYVALFPAGYQAHTSYLVECWKAEDFLPGGHTFEEARRGGRFVIRQLTDTHLLEWYDEEHLKMPLLFRKVALQIPYPDEGENKLLVRNISKSVHHPSERDWNIAKTKRISLMCGELEFLPNSPKCNNTLTLLLQANLKLKVIGKKFFDNMGNLRVLDLQHTGINGLPESISNLGHLKCLYLNDCLFLQSLPTEMKKLEQLELLDIRRTRMPCLPCEIWCLKTLRCLRISVRSSARDSREIVILSPQPCFSPEFLKLKFLEELTVHVYPQTPYRGLIVDEIKKAIKKDHKHLEVRWELKDSYLHYSNNVVTTGSGLNESIALTGSQSNGQDSTVPHSSSSITEPTTVNKLKGVIQLVNTEASTSTTNSQPTENTKDWVQKTFKDS